MNAQVFRNHFSIGETARPMLMRAGGGLQSTGDEGRAAGGSNGCIGKGAFEQHAVSREFADGWFLALIYPVSITAHQGR